MDSPPASDADGQAPTADGPSKIPQPSPPNKRRRMAPVLADCCRTCRLRKVKCSGNPGDGPCTNCARLELSCTFVTAQESEDATIARTTPSNSHTEAGTLRKRAQRACSQCHSHKTKCSGDLPRCKRCEAAGLACEYTPAKRRFTNVRFQNSDNAGENVDTGTGQARSDAITSPESSVSSQGGSFGLLIESPATLGAEETLMRRDLILRHMDAYMENMYWLPCQGFLHPETTYLEIQEGTLDPITAAAICCITAVFVGRTESGGEFGKKCSDHVEMHLFQNIYKFSEDLLILFALSTTFNLIRGEFAKVWQSFGVASRLMLGLRVNWDVPRPNQSFTQNETLRRICWQLFRLDRMLAGGYDEYIALRAENMKIALPCNEAAFRQNRPVAAEKLYDKPGSHPSTINLHGYQLRLIDLQHRIQVTTKRLSMSSASSHPYSDASKVMADINGLQNELTRFHMSLPPELFLSDQSVTKYMSSPERAGYVFLHTHLAASHIDLYRFSLPGQRDKVSADILRKLPREFLVRSQKQAVAHAMSLGRFCDAIQNEVDQMKDTGKIELAGDYSIFQMSSHCIRVLLVALQYKLYQNITEATTAPLWRSVQPDEAHIRFLMESVQRVTKPWCQLLKVAQQAYDDNTAQIEDFNKTRKVADQRAGESMFSSKPDDRGRLPGPDVILENIAAGTTDDLANRKDSRSSSLSREWSHAHSASAPALYATQSGAVHAAGVIGVDANAPGIPLFLAQARHGSVDSTQVPLVYDADNAMLPMADIGDMLPDANPLMPANAMPMYGVSGGGGGPPMFQHPIPQPNPHFIMAQQNAFSDAYDDSYTNSQGHADDFNRRQGMR